MNWAAQTVITVISGSQCIGDSLFFINNNFLTLGQRTVELLNNVETLSSYTITTVDSETIDFSYNNNTRNLTGNVKGNVFTALSASLSASSMVAKAWVSFDGKGTLNIIDSHNVSSITHNFGDGNYTINFETPMPNDLYAVIASAGQGEVFSSFSDYSTTLGVKTGGTKTRFAVQVQAKTGQADAEIDRGYVAIFCNQ